MVFDSEAGVVIMVLDVDRGTTALAFEAGVVTMVLEGAGGVLLPHEHWDDGKGGGLAAKINVTHFNYYSNFTDAVIPDHIRAWRYSTTAGENHDSGVARIWTWEVLNYARATNVN